MARHTYVKYITLDGISQASPEGAAMKQTITMDGLDIVKSVISAVEESDIEAWRRANGGGSDSDGKPGEKAGE